MRFHMRATEQDASGYYFPRWDRAISVEVDAPTRPEAFTRLWEILGDPSHGRGWTWTAKIDRVTESCECAKAATTDV